MITIPWTVDADALLDEIEEFLTGRRHGSADRVLTTVLFTDIVDSTQRAPGWVTRRGGASSDAHDQIVRGQLGRFGGREVNTTGDGFVARVRQSPTSAVRCAHGDRRCRIGGWVQAASGCPHRRVRTAGRRSRRSRGPHRGACRGAGRRPTRCSSHGPCATWSRAPAWSWNPRRARLEGPRPAVGAVRRSALSSAPAARTLCVRARRRRRDRELLDTVCSHGGPGVEAASL